MWIKLKKAWKGNEAGKVLNTEKDEQGQTLIDTDFAEAAADPTKDIVQEAAEAHKAQMKAFGKEVAEEAIATYLSAATGNKTGKKVVITTHDNALDDPKLGFKNGVEFWYTWCQAQCGKSVDAVEGAKKRLFGDGGYVKSLEARFKATGQNEAIDSEGGVFVLPEFSTETLMVKPTLALIRQYARTFSMAGSSYSIRARVDKNHTTSVAGGITVTRKFEGVASDRSKATFELVTFKPTKLTGYTAFTDEIKEDAPAFASLFPQMFADAIASQEESDFLTGTGAGEPLGAFHANNTSKKTVSKESGQAADTIVIANVLKMRAACYNYNQAIWLINQDAIPQLAVMYIGQVPVWLPSAKEDVPDMLLGRPVRYTDHGEAIGDLGDIRLGNFQEYGVADRGGLNTATSMHVKFLEGEELLKFWRRGDGQPLWRAVLTPVKGATRSPFVDLEAR
jgi:HK97 family phage major capsid protein